MVEYVSCNVLFNQEVLHALSAKPGKEVLCTPLVPGGWHSVKSLCSRKLRLSYKVKRRVVLKVMKHVPLGITFEVIHKYPRGRFGDSR